MPTEWYTSAARLLSTGDEFLATLLRILIVMTSVSVLVPIATTATIKRTVSGTVTTSDGSSVEDAIVTAIPVGASTVAGEMPSARSVAGGAFKIELPQGRYILRAKKEADGYPDPNFLLASDARAVFPEVSVDGTDIAGIKVILGSKGGILQGTLRDQVSRRPISDGKVVIRDARDPRAFVELTTDKKGDFSFAVPSKPMVICAHASGFMRTCVANGREQTLSAGEHRSFTIDLSPVGPTR